MYCPDFELYGVVLPSAGAIRCCISSNQPICTLREQGAATESFLV